MNKLIDAIVRVLLDGTKIKMSGDMHEPYTTLISGGYANFKDGIVWKNWKTCYWELSQNE